MKSTSRRWYNWKDLKEGTAYGGVIQVKGIHRVLRQTQRLVGSRYYPCKLARGKGQRESFHRLCELESWRNWSCGGAQPGPYKVQSWILSPPTLLSPAGVSPYQVQSEASWWESPAEAVHWDDFPEYRVRQRKVEKVCRRVGQAKDSQHMNTSNSAFLHTLNTRQTPPSSHFSSTCRAALFHRIVHSLGSEFSDPKFFFQRAFPVVRKMEDWPPRRVLVSLRVNLLDV